MYIPLEIQNLIFSYCSSPTATLMKFAIIKHSIDGKNRAVSKADFHRFYFHIYDSNKWWKKNLRGWMKACGK